jgi:hypothetical protein
LVAGRSADDEEKGKQGASIISALNPRNGETGESIWIAVYKVALLNLIPAS